jgi:hypothetical protein
MPNIRDWKNRESKMPCLVKKIGLIDFQESLTSRVKWGRCRRCEHEPSTAEPRAKRLDIARIGGRNRRHEAQLGVGARHATQNSLKINLQTRAPALPKSHRGFWVTP